MGLTFEHPGFLWLLLLAIPTAWVGLRYFASMSTVRRWSAVVLRVLLIAVITGMLAGAAAVRKTDKLAVIGVVDISGSVRLFGDAGCDPQGRPIDPIEAARAFFRDASRGRGVDDLLGVVVFDGASLAVAMPTRGDPLDRALDLQMAEGTNIGQALRYAAALIPPDAAGRIVLYTDGDETAGDALAAAAEIASRPGQRGRIPVDVIPVRLNAARETLVEHVDAPPRAPDQSTITVRVTLRSTEPARGTLMLLEAGRPLDINGEMEGFGRPLELPAGPHVELVTIPLGEGKIHKFEAVWEPETIQGPAGAPQLSGDTRPENNRGEAFTLTPGKGSVLIVSASQTSALADALHASDIDAKLITPEALPADLLALQEYDLVILENIPAESIPEAAQQSLAAHVRDLGAGLVMVGGHDSFGAGGWKGTPIEPLLPVKLDLPEQLVQPDAAVVFVLDNSGSMSRPVFASARNQQEIANEAAALAVRTLDKKDLVGVIVFNSDAHVIVPLRENTDPQPTTERILSIAPGGGTNLGPALEAAHAQLKDAKASLKHVIVLSDGVSMNKEGLPALAAKMKADGITISTIGVGDQMDGQNLGQIATRGGGQFFSVSNPKMLPRFFIKAVRVIRQPLIRDGEFRPVVLPAPSPLTLGVNATQPLFGLVLTQEREEPTITYAMAAPSGEPILAHWAVGLGQVAAWTSDAGTWARAWQGTPEFTAIWTQIARTISRPAMGGNSELTTEVQGDQLRIRLDAADDQGKPIDLLSIPATVYAPGSPEPVKLTLSQTGPGVYEGRVPAAEGGTYVVTAQPRAGNRALPPVFGGTSVSSGIEFRRLQSNPRLLERIAEITGGRTFNVTDADTAALFQRRGLPPSIARTPLWEALLVWAVIILLLDIGTRRIAWDRFVSREYGIELRKRAAEAISDRGTQSERAIAGLRRAVPASEPAPAMALSDEDAQRIAEAEAERRRAARRAAAVARQAHRESDAVRAPVASVPAPTPTDGKEAVEQGTEGLLAAKRRARERLAEGGDDAERA